MSTGERVRIRGALPGDAGALARLSGELGYPASAPQLGPRLESILSDPDHAVFVAEDDRGEVAGWVHVYIYKVLESDPRAEIGGLVSDPAARRRGIGRALMARAEQWSGEQGLHVVSLRTNVVREEAHRFYERIGYARVKTQFTYRKPL